MTQISEVVIFIGGPRHLQTAKIPHPQPYLQVPDKQLNILAPFNKVAEGPMFKVTTYRLEKYRPGPTVSIPMYVAQGTSLQEASACVGEYFFALLLEKHMSNQMQITELDWYKTAVHQSHNNLDQMKQSMYHAMQIVEKNSKLFDELFPDPVPPNPNLVGPKVSSEMLKLFPELKTTEVICPEVACASFGSVYIVIQHLNDHHKWPIETKIADWLESLDIKLEVKS